MIETAASDLNVAPVRHAGAIIALHWSIAILLAAQFAMGLRMESTHDLGARFIVFQMHKSVGMLILGLSLLRLVLRFASARPEPGDTGHGAFLARIVHTLFYAIMIGAPLTGWALVSTARIAVPTRLFGLMPLAHLPLAHSVNPAAGLGHAVLGWMLPGLVALHLGGAAWHVRLRDEVPARMVWRGWPVRLALMAGLSLIVAGAAVGLRAPLPDLWKAEQHSAPESQSAAVQQSQAQPVAGSNAPVTAIAMAPTSKPSAGPVPHWTVEPSSTLEFSVENSGTPVTGRFGRFAATIDFDPADLPHSHIAAHIDLASVTTGDGDRDAMLSSDSFFATSRFAEARFSSNRLTKTGDGRFAADGILDLHGVQHAVRIDFALRIHGNRANAAGTARLSRTTFGVGTGDYQSTDQLSDSVEIRLFIAAVAKAE